MLTGSPSSHVPWAADWHVCEWQKIDARCTGHPDQSISIFSYATYFPSIQYEKLNAKPRWLRGLRCHYLAELFFKGSNHDYAKICFANTHWASVRMTKKWCQWHRAPRPKHQYFLLCYLFSKYSLWVLIVELNKQAQPNRFPGLSWKICLTFK